MASGASRRPGRDVNYGKRGSAVGTVLTDGGMNTSVAGIRNAIGMTTIMTTIAITTTTESFSFKELGPYRIRSRFRQLRLMADYV